MKENRFNNQKNIYQCVISRSDGFFNQCLTISIFSLSPFKLMYFSANRMKWFFLDVAFKFYPCLWKISSIWGCWKITWLSWFSKLCWISGNFKGTANILKINIIKMTPYSVRSVRKIFLGISFLSYDFYWCFRCSNVKQNLKLLVKSFISHLFSIARLWI